MTAFQPGVPAHGDIRAGRHFALLCLDREDGATAADVQATLTSLWALAGRLRAGVIWPDIPPVDPEGLTVLVGYATANTFSNPAGGPILAGTALRWAPDLAGNPADCDVALQLTASSEAAVNRAAVEIDRLLREAGALRLAALYPGYRRPDRRSWLGFHDGVANPDPSERADAIQVPPGGEPAWLTGGTYLAFLRIRVRLEHWDNIDPAKQELLVGRQKGTGAPLAVDPDRPGEYCPVALPAPGDVFAPGNEAARDAMPVPADDPSGVGRSHVQRARRMLTGRIVRQGYEYLAPVGGNDVLHTGLNFVSFQSTPEHFTRVLTGPSWFGHADFGGQDAEGSLTDLLEVYAAGIYAVPPLCATGCPGAAALFPS